MDANDDIPILALKLVLNDKSQSWSGEAAATADDEANIECQSRFTENCREENGDVIAREVKSAKKVLVAVEIVTMVESALDDAIREIFHNAQNSVRSDIYNVAQRVILDLLCKEVIGKSSCPISKSFSPSMKSPRNCQRCC